MENESRQYAEFLDPNILREKLIMISLFIAVFENFKDTIVDRVKSNYLIGWKDGALLYDGYDQRVLSLVASGKNKEIRATLQWLIKNKAISEADEKKFVEFTDVRNKLAHDMTTLLYSELPKEIIEKYNEMLQLYKKIMRWLICEIEMPVSTDLNPEDVSNIDWDNVSDVNLELLKIMSDVAINSSKEYMKMMEEVIADQDRE